MGIGQILLNLPTEEGKILEPSNNTKIKHENM